jgi:hypothetical protein
MLADRLANDTGVAVYVPDLFDGACSARARRAPLLTRAADRERARAGRAPDPEHARGGARAEGLHVHAEEDRRHRLDHALCVPALFLVLRVRADGHVRRAGFIRNRPATKLPHVKALAALLTGPEHGHTKLGAVGSVARCLVTACMLNPLAGTATAAGSSRTSTRRAFSRAACTRTRRC